MVMAVTVGIMGRMDSKALGTLAFLLLMALYVYVAASGGSV